MKSPEINFKPTICLFHSTNSEGTHTFLVYSMCSRQRSSNKGYAFVNLTTADAAAGLYRALHGCRWDPSLRSDKIIRVDAARIQVI